jgi:putative ABC transport system permease protein
MIDFPSTIKISFRALRVNLMRSLLTMLGIIIGVGAVILILAIGSGAKKQISDQIASMGSNLLIVLPGATTSGGLREGTGSQPTLSLDDNYAIAKEASAVQYAAPAINGTAQIIYGNQNWSTVVMGTTSDMLSVRNWPLSDGRPFTDEDVRNATKVCLMGQTVITNLFGDIDPIGLSIRIKGIPFTVIGILAPKGQSLIGQDQDDTIFIPVTTAQKKVFGVSFRGMIRLMMLQAKGVDYLSVAEKQVTEILRQRHHIQQGRDDDFSIRNLTEIMQTAEQATVVMTLLLGAIASVSLLVGGIGIMNIMLVSVTERTREIGIRLAVGAKARDIRAQFLIEALILSLIGGAIGIIIGVAGAESISIFSKWTTIVTPISIITAFCFSAFVGIFFGFYPAYKASLLNPIDALRYE